MVFDVLQGPTSCSPYERATGTPEELIRLHKALPGKHHDQDSLRGPGRTGSVEPR